MPSSSPAQHRFMEMVAHNPQAAKRVGVPQKVGHDFVNADMDAKRHVMAKLLSKKPSAQHAR